jgi:hypothetical protein
MRDGTVLSPVEKNSKLAREFLKLAELRNEIATSRNSFETDRCRRGSRIGLLQVQV